MAVMKDIMELKQYKVDVSGLCERVGQTPEMTRELVEDLISQVLTLNHRGAELGGDAIIFQKQVIDMEDALTSGMRRRLVEQNDLEGLKSFDSAIQSKLKQRALYLETIFLQQLARKDTPITEDQIIPSVLSEPTSTIVLFMKNLGLQSQEKQDNVLKEGFRILYQASTEIPDYDEKVKALGATPMRMAKALLRGKGA